MTTIEILIDKGIEQAIDKAIFFLDTDKKLEPFCFLIQKDGCTTDVVPNKDEFHFEENIMVDAFKDFANEKLDDDSTEGYCITSTISTFLKGEEIEALALFFKFKNDHLPLKTRIYYFPYTFVNQKPYIDFESAFSSEG